MYRYRHVRTVALLVLVVLSGFAMADPGTGLGGGLS